MKTGRSMSAASCRSFLLVSNHEEYSADGEDQFATRVMSGFNPGSINFNIVAPEMNGITVEGFFQINHHLHGPSVQNAGLFEGRVAILLYLEILGQ